MNPIVLNHFGRRTAFIQMLRERGAKVGAEIGTDHGHYAQQLLEGIPSLEELYCVDPWLAYTEGKDVKDQAQVDAIYEEAKMRLGPYQNHFISRKTSMEAVMDFADNSLDFVFIDGNHEYEHVLEDITQWTKKVKLGGIVAGHDYTENPERKYGVIKAVQEYIKDNHIAPLFIMHVPPHVPKRNRGNFADCWMFFKQ